MNARRNPRLSCSASNTWRNQSNTDLHDGNPSRFSNDAATANGLRNTTKKIGSTCSFPVTDNQNGTSRQARGSFTIQRGAVPNSCRNSSAISSRIAIPMDVTHQPSGIGRKSSQCEPNDARSRSCSSRTSFRSQKPVSLLLAADGISLVPSCAPSRLKTRVTAEVPLRCMPRTMRAVFLMAIVQ